MSLPQEATKSNYVFFSLSFLQSGVCHLEVWDTVDKVPTMASSPSILSLIISPPFPVELDLRAWTSKQISMCVCVCVMKGCTILANGMAHSMQMISFATSLLYMYLNQQVAMTRTGASLQTTVFLAWYCSFHLLVTLAQLMKPGVDWNTLYAVGNFLCNV